MPGITHPAMRLVTPLTARFSAAALREAALLAVIVMLGAAVRFSELAVLPPGLYTDEAYYALDAMEVLAGARPIYFPANNGREPLFIYTLAASLAAFGRTPWAVRAPAAVFGTLNILAVYGLGRAAYGRRAGLLAAAVAAGTLWAVALSRLGLRATTLPAVGAAFLAVTIAAWRTRRPALLGLAGALGGLCFYTYLSARLIPVALLAGGVFWYSAESWRGRRQALPVRDLAYFLGPWALMIAPLAFYAFNQPQIYLGRVEQVSVFNSAGAAATVLNNLGAVLGMFIGRGDLNARHNLPGRPVFDLALGAAFWLGVGASVDRAVRRGDGAAALTLCWTATLLAPTVFSQDAPHFLRAIGALPTVCLFPALALDRAWAWAVRQGRGWRWAGPALMIGLVGFNGARTAADYFGAYARDPNTAYYFQAATVTLARDTSAYLTGGAREVYLDRRLWDSFAALRFLLGGEAAVQVRGLDETPAASLTAEARSVVWPYGDPAPVTAVKWLPPAALITAEAGPLFRNDRELDPYPLYVTYTARPRSAGPAPAAVFDSGIILQAADVLWVGTRLRVALTWAAAPPVTDSLHVFIHLRAGEMLLDQADGPLGGELYPATQWRASDWVEQSATLNLPADSGPGEIFVGLYRYPSGERLNLAGGGPDTVRLALPRRP